MLNKLLPIRYFLLCLLGLTLSSGNSGMAQVVLGTAPYEENFDNIGDGLPAGWTVRTGANSTSLGNEANLVTNTTSWRTTSGNFRNVASGTELEVDASVAEQAAAENRALALRQTGAFGDPGGAFVLQLANTAELANFSLQFRLQSLDPNSPRVATWRVDYGVGANPTEFQTVASAPADPSTGGNTFASNLVNVDFGTRLNDINAPVWIRIVALNSTSGGGNRPTTGIDDFALNYTGSGVVLPGISLSLESIAFEETVVGEESVATYSVTGTALDAPISLAVTGPFSISENGSDFSSNLELAPEGGEVFVKFAPASIGLFDDEITHTSGNESASLAIDAIATDGSGFTPIAVARALPLQTSVSIAGRITVAGELGGVSYLQDGTGGIPIFFFNLANTANIGDSVQITGPIGAFNEQVQISGSGITFEVIDAPTRILDPKPIALLELPENEGLLVEVQQVEFDNKNFVFLPNNNQQITDGVTNAELRVDANVSSLIGLLKPQERVDITGVVGSFRGTAQLLPRFAADVPDTADPTPETDNIPRNTTFDVASFNIEFFGTDNPDFRIGRSSAEQAANVKAVFEALDADIIALQEIANDDLLREIVSEMPGYAVVCSDRFSFSFQDDDSDFPSQQLCYVYNTATVEVLESRAMFAQRYDSARTAFPELIPDYPTGNPQSFFASGRLPYLLTANVTIEGVQQKINVINIHASARPANYERRVYDAQVLKDSLDTYYSDENVIFTGDYNDFVLSSTADGQPSPYRNFVEDANYKVLTKQLEADGFATFPSFNSMLDHITINEPLLESFIDGSAQVFLPFNIVNNFLGTTSDHLPVLARYMLMAEEDMFVPENLEFIAKDDCNRAIISWDNIAEAEFYEYRIRKAGTENFRQTRTNDVNNPDFEGISVNENRTILSLQVPIAPETAYEFEVRSNLGEGEFSEWAALEFTTEGALANPDELYTFNISNSTATLAWTVVECAEFYEYRIRKEGATGWRQTRANDANNPDFAGISEENGIVVVNLQSPLDANTTYEWEVRSVYPQSTPATSWATRATFTTCANQRPCEQLERVEAVLNCVVANPDGTFTARFGYFNPNDVPVRLESGATNFIAPAPRDRDQPTLFLPGTYDGVFEVNFSRGNIIWNLDRRPVIASSRSNSCTVEGEADELSFNNAMHLNYRPNPVVDYLSIDFVEGQQLDYISVFDDKGKPYRLNQMPVIHDSTMQLDLQNLRPGLYLLHLHLNGQLKTHRIMKQ